MVQLHYSASYNARRVDLLGWEMPIQRCKRNALLPLKVRLQISRQQLGDTQPTQPHDLHSPMQEVLSLVESSRFAIFRSIPARSRRTLSSSLTSIASSVYWATNTSQPAFTTNPSQHYRSHLTKNAAHRDGGSLETSCRISPSTLA